MQLVILCFDSENVLQMAATTMAIPEHQQQNTGYGLFMVACWTTYKRKFSDQEFAQELIMFHQQCSVWWYNLSIVERDSFETRAEASNKQQELVKKTYMLNQTGSLPTFQEQLRHQDPGVRATIGNTEVRF